MVRRMEALEDDEAEGDYQVKPKITSRDGVFDGYGDEQEPLGTLGHGLEKGEEMSAKINIAARRIFNRIDKDIGNRYGVRVEWDGMSPNARQDIRRTWERIITEEIEKHTSELQARVKRLEAELNENGLVLQKLQDERDKAISLADRLWKALAAADKYIDEIQSDDSDYDTWI